MDLLKKNKKWLTSTEIAQIIGKNKSSVDTCLRKLRVEKSVKFIIDNSQPYKRRFIYSI